MIYNDAMADEQAGLADNSDYLSVPQPDEEEFFSCYGTPHPHGTLEAECVDDEEPNRSGRESIMKVKVSDKFQEIKERCFHRLNIERQKMIRQRRELSGYGTHSKKTKEDDS